jgi:DNA-binding NarL/FixJ family response regulator
MHGERTLIEAALKAGVNGYLLKDDRTAIQNLGGTINIVLQGGSYLSQYTLEKLSGSKAPAVSLSSRQLQILSMCAANPNLTKAEIAKSLNIADSTVRNLLASAYQRLEVRNLTAAITAARALGILTAQLPLYPYPQDELDLVDSLR